MNTRYRIAVLILVALTTIVLVGVVADLGYVLRLSSFAIMFPRGVDTFLSLASVAIALVALKLRKRSSEGKHRFEFLVLAALVFLTSGLVLSLLR